MKHRGRIDSWRISVCFVIRFKCRMNFANRAQWGNSGRGKPEKSRQVQKGKLLAFPHWMKTRPHYCPPRESNPRPPVLVQVRHPWPLLTQVSRLHLCIAPYIPSTSKTIGILALTSIASLKSRGVDGVQVLTRVIDWVSVSVRVCALLPLLLSYFSATKNAGFVATTWLSRFGYLTSDSTALVTFNMASPSRSTSCPLWPKIPQHRPDPTSTQYWVSSFSPSEYTPQFRPLLVCSEMAPRRNVPWLVVLPLGWMFSFVMISSGLSLNSVWRPMVLPAKCDEPSVIHTLTPLIRHSSCQTSIFFITAPVCSLTNVNPVPPLPPLALLSVKHSRLIFEWVYCAIVLDLWALLEVKLGT